MDKKSTKILQEILGAIRDLNTLFLEAGVDDHGELIRALRRLAVKRFVDEDISAILSKEE